MSEKRMMLQSRNFVKNNTMLFFLIILFLAESFPYLSLFLLVEIRFIEGTIFHSEDFIGHLTRAD